MGPEQVMQIAEERAPDGFNDIGEVIPPEELEAIAARYKQIAGFDREKLNSQNIGHFDLKLQNVMLCDDIDHIKLIDFGFSKKLRPRESMNHMLGTLLYMAPEVLSSEYGVKADVWSLGVILYNLLCHNFPYLPPDRKNWGFKETARAQFIVILKQSEIRIQSCTGSKELSPEAADLVNSMLKFKPSERISAKDALRYPWLEVPGQDDEVTKPISKKSMLPPIFPRFKMWT
jgi:serine/threonine protein kinase